MYKNDNKKKPVSPDEQDVPQRLIQRRQNPQ